MIRKLKVFTIAFTFIFGVAALVKGVFMMGDDPMYLQWAFVALGAGLLSVVCAFFFVTDWG